MSHDAKLAYMANQIGKFFAHQPADQAVDSIADHLLKFWDPRMRRAIVVHIEQSGEAGLDPRVLKAIEKVRAHDRQKTAVVAR
ncbi:MAG: formate dehydrogenase subunit delta [Alphaproteobacteria bacterium]|jgi:formate dehydrogenase subunit delta|nr:formate dehydrogenase subunit delta [Alphaproteobacteria bacterium]